MIFFVLFLLLGLTYGAPQWPAFGFGFGFGTAPDKPEMSLGTGPYKAHFFQDPSLPRHTIFQPKNTQGLKIPVVVWGNPGCFASGDYSREFLGEVASYGVILIAPGNIGEFGSFTDVTWIRESMDWVSANAGRGNYAHVDGSRMAAWGRSCGGIEALMVARDSRIGHVGIFNAGSTDEASSRSVVGRITKPVFYFMGGPADFTLSYAQRDYQNLPANTPAWLGSNGRGHDNTHEERNGGSMGAAAVALARWMLRGDFNARKWFTDGGSRVDGFNDPVFKNLASIFVFPI